MPRPVVPPAPQGAAATEPPDRIPAKIAKYVPAEQLAWFVPATMALAAQPGRKGWVVAALVVGAALTPLYLFMTSRNLPEDQRPLWHFYVLAVLAFGLWAIGSTPSVHDYLFTLDDVVAGFLVTIAVVAIPLLDTFFNYVQGRRHQSA